jgi:hypothetical protein
MTNDSEACRKILLALEVQIESRPMRSNMPARDNNYDQTVHRQRNSNLFGAKPSTLCVSGGENLGDDLKSVALFV